MRASEHLDLHADFVAYLLVDVLRRRHGQIRSVLARHPFLEEHFQRSAEAMPEGISWDDAVDWWEKRLVEFEEAHVNEHLPLLAVAEGASLGLAGRVALVAAGMGEDDARIGAVWTELQDPILTPRPTLGTLAGLVAPVARQEAHPAAAVLHLATSGVVAVPNGDDPRPDWIARVPLHLWDALRGLPPEGAYRFVAREDAPTAEDVGVPRAVQEHLARLPVLFEEGRLDAFVLRGRRGSAREDVARAVAASMERATLTVDLSGARHEDVPGVGPLAAALDAVPVLVVDPDVGERARVPRLHAYSGPVFVVLGTAGGIDGAALGRTVTIELPLEGLEQRRRVWDDALPGGDPEALAELSRRVLLPVDHLRRVAGEAVSGAVLSGLPVPSASDVAAAGRVLDRSALETRAVRLRPFTRPFRLVTSPLTEDRLGHLLRRCRHREALGEAAGAGFGGDDTRGVRALFTGRSGTGKTLAARLLAADLGMDVYRVDLASTVDKYVGQSEKNLHAVLSAAEEHDIVLLIDEGDALMASRTNVKSANDRYANLETDFLLQRLESHQGIVLVTTNVTENIDPAFQRRMDVVVAFVEPGPFERAQLWELHLPDRHRVDPAFLDTVAERCALTGGQIRNAALFATLLALDAGEDVDASHVEVALASEYAKAGATSPLAAPGADRHGRGVQAFVEALP